MLDVSCHFPAALGATLLDGFPDANLPHTQSGIGICTCLGEALRGGDGFDKLWLHEHTIVYNMNILFTYSEMYVY